MRGARTAKTMILCGALACVTVAGCQPATPTPSPTASTVAAAAAPQPTSAIVGGVPVSRTDYPYFVYLYNSGGFGSPAVPYCGGSLIAPEWVLTAAHCVDATPAPMISLLGGAITGATTVHPLWNGHVTSGHDLALLNVPTAATAGIATVQVGSPWDATPYAADTPSTAMGVGLTSPSGTVGNFLAIDTVIRSDAYMADRFDSDQWVGRLMIGAGSRSATTCNGDSGGPLVVGAGTPRVIQVGLTSFGPSACNGAGVFAELSGPQLAWVASVVPSIVSVWGPCTSSAGVPGHSIATYGPDAAQGPNHDGSHRFWNIACVSNDARLMQVRHSQGCGNVIASTAVLYQGLCTSGPFNLFELVPTGAADEFRLIVSATGQCLTVASASTALRAVVREEPCGPTRREQDFALHATDSGFVEIVAQHSGKCLDVEGDSFGTGVHIWQFTCDYGYNQQFRFIKPENCAPTGILGGPADCPITRVVR